MTIIFNTDENFWELYPEFKLALSFKDLYKSDKSRNKESSSRVMWYVALTTDPGSRYYNLPIEEKHLVLGLDYMEDEKYYEKHQKKLDQLIEDYKMTILTPAQRHLLEWDKKIDERSKFINNLPYNLETYEDLDKMMAKTQKVYDILKKIKEDLSREEGDGQGKGGQQKSLND